MTPHQALQILHQVAEAFAMNGTDRDRAREAAQTLSDLVKRDLKVKAENDLKAQAAKAKVDGQGKK